MALRWLVCFHPLRVVICCLLGLSLVPTLLHAPTARLDSLATHLAQAFPILTAQLASRAVIGMAQRQHGGQVVPGLTATPTTAAPPAGLGPAEQTAWLAAATRGGPTSAPALTTFFPARFTDPFVVASGDLEASLQPLGAHPAPARQEAGTIVYRDAYPSVDSVHIVGPGRSEELLHLRDRAAPTTFGYLLTAKHADTRVEQWGGGVRLTDATGRCLLIEAPWVVDGGGQRRSDVVRWELSDADSVGTRRLDLILDPRGLTYPLVIDPSWTNTLDLMATARTDHTATLLPDGRVLVVGGRDLAGNALATVEIYRPLLGLWDFTGSMSVATWNHTATLLPNGKVLVAGGFNGLLSQVARAELYDPATGVWTTTGAMAARRERHTATLLNNGTVLVSGGRDQTLASLAGAETYNPATGAWSSTQNSMSAARQYHTATLLDDGRVLVVGGLATTVGPPSVTTWLASAELYQPTTRQWTTTGSLTTGRGRHTATRLPDGHVLVVGGQIGGAGGGQISGVTVTATTEIWTTAGAWSTPATPGPLSGARQAHTATLLTNGGVLIAGGADEAGGSLNTTELYSFASVGWTPGTIVNLPAPASQVTNARYGHAATMLTTGQVLLTGGFHSYVNSPFFHGVIYDPTVASWSNSGQFAGGVVGARSEHTATLLADGRVLVAGGKDTSGAPLASIQVYDPATNAWTARQSMARVRFGHTATLLPDGNVLVTGGLGDAISLTDVALYDPVADQWRNSPVVPSMSAQRWGHTATLLKTGLVLVVGGNFSDTGYNTSAELYDPIANRWTATGSLATSRFKHTATLMPDGFVQAAGGFNGIGIGVGNIERYNPATGLWSFAAGSGPNWEHTATLMPNGGVAYVGGRFVAPPSIRYGHTATVLVTGEVLVIGGKDSTGQAINAVATYDPGTDRITMRPPLSTPRAYHTATLLPDGTVLVTGGVNSSGGALASAERYDPGLGHQDAWRPVLSQATSPLYLGQPLTATGTRFKGIGEGAGGNGGQQSATNMPILRLQSLSNEQVAFLPVDPAAGWSDTHVTSKVVADFPVGHALATVVTNGIPGRARVIVVLPPRTSTLTVLTSTQNPSAIGASITFKATVNGPTGNTALASGTIAFKNGVATLASVALSAGSAELTTSSLGPGVHSITAVYGGDARFLGSTSGVLSQQVVALPTVSAGGPYSVAERATITLSASGTTAQGSTPSFFWDLDNDGQYEEVGQQIAFAAGDRDGPGVAPIAVKGCDTFGYCATATATVAITNTAPVATFVAPPQVVVGTPIGMALTTASDVQADLASLQYAFDCGLAGYGAFSAAATASCPTDAAGSRTVRGTVRDKDGGTTEYTTTVTITSGGPGPSPTIGATTWYFAEGWTGPGFDEYLTIQNPNNSAAQVRITYFLTGAAPVQKSFSLPGNYRDTVVVHDDARGVGRNAGKGWAVSAKVESTNGVGIVVERPMYFTYSGGIDGGHNVMGVNAPQQIWYFAEGWTGAGFDEYLTIMNPNDTDASVTIDYFLEGAAPIQKPLVVPKASRLTVAVHETDNGVGRGRAVSARVTTSHPNGIVVERPMYFQYGGSLGGVTGGHNVMGAGGPRPVWYFPDGNTATGYDAYLTIMNTSGQPAQVRLTYYVVGEPTPRTRDIEVAANSRRTVKVYELSEGVGRGLRLGAKVETLNGVDLVVERPVYFRYSPSVNGGHNIMGAPQPATAWLFAEGYTGPGFDEELVILNPNGQVANVTITYFRGEGKGPVNKSLAVAPRSRTSVAVHETALGVGRGEAVSAKVESTNGVGIVVERPMYFAYSPTINGGHTVMGYVP